MRVRNISHAKASLQESNLVVQDPTALQGRWKSILNKEKLVVEIGCGKGGYTAMMSQQNPNSGFVAIEKNATIAYLALCKLQTLTNDNFKLINMDAQMINEVFAEGEVDVIHLNFSDPWPKTRTHKRRLSHLNFLTNYDKILSSDGKIIMKTDNYDLFVYSLNSFVGYGFEILEIDTDFRSSLKEDPITEYEQKFINKNIKINRVIVGRKK